MKKNRTKVRWHWDWNIRAKGWGIFDGEYITWK